MNYVWSILIIISLIFAAFSGTLQETVTAGFEGAANAFPVLLSFAGIMCFWSGFLKIAGECGAAGFCEKLLSPIIRRLFPKVSDRKNITMNISELDEQNGKTPYPSREMSRFAVLNTASLQLIPTTIIALLAAFGDKDPYRIVPLIWISSSVSLVCALFADFVLSKKR